MSQKLRKAGSYKRALISKNFISLGFNSHLLKPEAIQDPSIQDSIVRTIHQPRTIQCPSALNRDAKMLSFQAEFKAFRRDSDQAKFKLLALAGQFDLFSTRRDC